MTPPSNAIEVTTQQLVDRWFTRRGVPTFAERYPVSKLLPVLMAPLFVVTAAQLATLPLLDLETWQVALGPALVTLLALPVLPTLQWILDPRPEEGRPTPRKLPLIIALAAAAAVVVLLLATGDDDAMVAEVAVNLGVLLLALVACGILLRPEVWVRDGEEERNLLQWSMFTILVAAVIAFALEGMPVAPFDARALGALPASAPPALPALPVVVLLGFLAVLMSRKALGGEIGRDWPGDRREALLSISPVLVLLLGAETTLLPTTVNAWVEALVPLALLVLFLVLSLGWPLRWSWYRTAPQLRRRASERNPSLGIALLFAIPAYLVVYPALSGQFEVAMLINLFYLVVAGIAVAFGVDRMAVWAAQKLFKTYKQILLGIARGLPLLLVFTAFFLFTTELWQAARAMPLWAYLTLIGSVVGITALFLLIVALADLKRHSRFLNWADVRTAALRIEVDRSPEAEIRHLVAELGEKVGVTATVDAGRSRREDAAAAAAAACPVDPAAPSTKEDVEIEDVRRLLDEANLIDEAEAERCDDQLHPLELSLRRRLNVLGVIGVYQALIFIPLFFTAFGVFLGTGLLAVRNPLLDNWINGDQDPSRPREPENFFDDSFFTWPWTRVALFLAAFSILYVAVDILRSPDMRAQFLAGADEGVRQRLAVRKVYEERLPHWSPEPAADDAVPGERPRWRLRPGRARPA